MKVTIQEDENLLNGRKNIKISKVSHNQLVTEMLHIVNC